MKRTWLLTALFLLLAAAVYFTLRQKKNQPASHVSWDMEFAVADPQQIAKIFLADRTGQTATLERNADGSWTYNGRYKARPTAIQLLLETMSHLNVLYIPPKAAESTMIKSLAAEGIKVELYDKSGEKLKRYYVGGVTNDERGTFMIMEGAEQPYVVHVPAFIGQLRVRYMLGDDNWRDRTVFAEKPETIQSVSVEYPQQKSESFRLEKTGPATYAVTPFYNTTRPSKYPQRKGVAEAYLLQFESLGAEAYETSNPDRDSVTQLVPFAIVTLRGANGAEKRVRFWPLSIEHRPEDNSTYVFRYYADVNNGEAFLLTQERVFGPIFRDYHFFFDEGEKKRLLN